MIKILDEKGSSLKWHSALCTERLRFLPMNGENSAPAPRVSLLCVFTTFRQNTSLLVSQYEEVFPQNKQFSATPAEFPQFNCIPTSSIRDRVRCHRCRAQSHNTDTLNPSPTPDTSCMLRLPLAFLSSQL